MLRTGSVVDATLIAAPSSTKNQDGKRGPEMHQVKKGNQWLKASIRAKVEHPFRVVKCQFGFTKVRYRGLNESVRTPGSASVRPGIPGESGRSPAN